MTVFLIAILAISAISLVFNAGYIVHELGIYPHTKNRKTPVERKFMHRSLYDKDRKKTHDFYITHHMTIELRKLGHKDIYTFKDPYEALEKVIRRYEELPVRSRYDDLVHLSNYISNTVKSDERINQLIERAIDISVSKPFKTN
ncbi:MAG TPA: hypothetical protein VFN30_01840 [Chitinophagaceae bacterium]|nr:hypothetical protein [Chitinophagaceae bacterium]